MMERPKLCFVDTIGLKYKGDTLEERGLGGSESAVILLSKELTKLGFYVTVFNACEEEGIFDGVRYLDLSRIPANEEYYDVMVSSRSVVPYIPMMLKDDCLQKFGCSPELYANLISKSRYKVLWLHDTFCLGDEYVEPLLVDGYYNELFTLSDWHTNYVTNSSHWGHRPRRYEVLKKKIFQTRNGVVSHIKEVDILAKDKNLFVYNSSVSKGMIPLLDECWPRIKEQVPDGKLVIIGGYYRRDESADELEQQFLQKKDQYDGKNGITFTGVIKQQEVAEILSRASLMIYPAVFPETFGISTLEAINYNVPLVGCRFGALEQIGTDSTSFLIEYPIDWDDNQYTRFTNMFLKAYNDDYLRLQKSQACNAFKKYIGWDSVAIQWRQHFYKELHLFLGVEETREARSIANRLTKLFGARHLNPEDTTEYNPSKFENRIVIVSPFYNSEKYLKLCVESVACQDYDNYLHVLINDMSEDNGLEIIRETVLSLPENLRGKFITINNAEKKFALKNQVFAIDGYAGPNDIVVLLDGDDWLVNDPDVFNVINNEYNSGAMVTYGSCFSLADSINLIAQPYPEEVKRNKSYRTHLFSWGMPYTHTRTFKKSVFDKIPKSEFLDGNGLFYGAGGDNAMFYPLLENCEPEEIRAIQRVMYVYNDTNPLNDYKIHAKEQISNAEGVRKVEITRHKDIGKTLYQIYPDVLARKPEALKLHKEVLKNREEVWIDNTDAPTIKPRIEWVVNKLKALNVPLNASIMDIGAWTGKFAHDISKSGYNNITCLDISDKCVEVGKANFPQFDWIQGDVEDMTIRKTYDVILMGEVVEHLINPFETLDYVRTCLNDGGHILYTIPTEDKVFGENPGSAVEHISKITGEDLLPYSNDLSILQSKGFFDWYVGSIASIPKSYKLMKSTTQKQINILIALPTAKNIETDTFLSLYRLNKPDNCSIHLECFYGYRIDQVRNLICHFAIQNKFDYVFFVDSDIVLPPDALIKLLESNKDIITGVYLQRKPGERIPEIYVSTGRGGTTNINPNKLLGTKPLEIAGCGFGCVLVSVDTLVSIGYPQFEYHNTIDFSDTISEDTDFCMKSKKKGIPIFVDPTLRCDHIGVTKYRL